jgi:hypothetical protein
VLTAVLRRHALDFDTLAWTVGGLPFLTTPGTLVAAVQQAIRAETGLRDAAVHHRRHQRRALHCANLPAGD